MSEQISWHLVDQQFINFHPQQLQVKRKTQAVLEINLGAA